MKAIIENLKGLIEAEKKTLESHHNNSERLFAECFKLLPERKEEALSLYQSAETERLAEMESNNKLRCLRHSLASLRRANGEKEGSDFSIFEPESDIYRN